MYLSPEARAKLADAKIIPEPQNARAAAGALVAYFDAHSFGGWFGQGGRFHDDVMAVFANESNFDFGAIGDRHLPDMSWGIGQVRGTTAQDRGVSDPRALLDPATGVFVAMAQLKWSWDFLESRMGRAPTKREWIGSYNAGVGNALQGRIPAEYVARWARNGGRA